MWTLVANVESPLVIDNIITDSGSFSYKVGAENNETRKPGGIYAEINCASFFRGAQKTGEESPTADSIAGNRSRDEARPSEGLTDDRLTSKGLGGPAYRSLTESGDDITAGNIAAEARDNIGLDSNSSDSFPISLASIARLEIPVRYTVPGPRSR